MAYLLDTCALSELVAPKKSRQAIERLLALPRDEIYITTVTIGELCVGIEEMRPCARKSFLAEWLYDQVIPHYGNRTYAVDTAVALEWGRLQAELNWRGQTMQVRDAFIAAVALVYGLTLVTRNVTDFENSGVALYSPWENR